MREESFKLSDLSLSECISLLYVGTHPELTDLPPSDAETLSAAGLAATIDHWMIQTPHGEVVAARIAEMASMQIGVPH